MSWNGLVDMVDIVDGLVDVVVDILVVDIIVVDIWY